MNKQLNLKFLPFSLLLLSLASGCFAQGKESVLTATDSRDSEDLSNMSDRNNIKESKKHNMSPAAKNHDKSDFQHAYSKNELSELLKKQGEANEQLGKKDIEAEGEPVDRYDPSYADSLVKPVSSDYDRVVATISECKAYGLSPEEGAKTISGIADAEELLFYMILKEEGIKTDSRNCAIQILGLRKNSLSASKLVELYDHAEMVAVFTANPDPNVDLEKHFLSETISVKTLIIETMGKNGDALAKEKLEKIVSNQGYLAQFAKFELER